MKIKITCPNCKALQGIKEEKDLHLTDRCNKCNALIHDRGVLIAQVR